MRVCTLALLSCCAILSAGCGRRSQASTPPQTQAEPGADSCAVYVQRVAPGARCAEVDHGHCSCELLSAAGTQPSSPPPPPEEVPAAGPVTPPQPAPAAANATLVFPPGPRNTTVRCLSGPCPVTTAELITAPYPAVVAVASGTAIELEFQAADHRPFTGNYTVHPGTNQVPFTLERIVVAAPDSAMIMFQGAPEGTTVQCVSGPCPDKKAHPLASFPEVKLTGDDQTLLLRFNAPGYRTALNSFQVSRGPVMIPVLMERGTDGRR